MNEDQYSSSQLNPFFCGVGKSAVRTGLLFPKPLTSFYRGKMEELEMEPCLNSEAQTFKDVDFSNASQTESDFFHSDSCFINIHSVLFLKLKKYC